MGTRADQQRYYAGMKRTTIAITDELAIALEAEAQRRGESVSAVVREALEEHLPASARNRRVLPFAAVGSSGDGPSDVASNIDEYLEKYGYGEPRGT